MARRTKRNPEAQQRARIAKYFYRCLKELNLSPREVSRALGIEVQTIRRLPYTVPQLRVLYPLGAFIEQTARKQGAVL